MLNKTSILQGGMKSFEGPEEKKVLFSLKGTSMKPHQEEGHKLRSFLTILKHLTLTSIVNFCVSSFGLGPIRGLEGKKGIPDDDSRQRPL